MTSLIQSAKIFLAVVIVLVVSIVHRTTNEDPATYKVAILTELKRVLSALPLPSIVKVLLVNDIVLGPLVDAVINEAGTLENDVINWADKTTTPTPAA